MLASQGKLAAFWNAASLSSSKRVARSLSTEITAIVSSTVPSALNRGFVALCGISHESYRKYHEVRRGQPFGPSRFQPVHRPVLRQARRDPARLQQNFFQFAEASDCKFICALGGVYLANRDIYHDGWIAATTPPAPPWLMRTAKLPEDVVNGYKRELYNVAEDYSESNNLAGKMPDKLREHSRPDLVTLGAGVLSVLNS
jgi:hypothetical protein